MKVPIKKGNYKEGYNYKMKFNEFGTVDDGVYLFIYLYEFVDSLASRRRKSGIIPKPRFCLFLKQVNERKHLRNFSTLFGLYFTP
jgi:hypothetical protein